MKRREFITLLGGAAAAWPLAARAASRHHGGARNIGVPTTRFLFPKKIGNWIGVPTTRKFPGPCGYGWGSAPPRPPFVQMKNTPGGSFPRGGFPGAAFGARDRSLGRSIGGWLPVSCLGLPHSCHI